MVSKYGRSSMLWHQRNHLTVYHNFLGQVRDIQSPLSVFSTYPIIGQIRHWSIAYWWIQLAMKNFALSLHLRSFHEYVSASLAIGTVWWIFISPTQSSPLPPMVLCRPRITLKSSSPLDLFFAFPCILDATSREEDWSTVALPASLLNNKFSLRFQFFSVFHRSSR
jgi:hypothetical protein